MKNRNIITAATLGMALIYLSAIAWWHIYTPNENLTIQQPGADNRPEGSARNVDDVLIGEYFMQYEEISSSLTGKWVCFRGEDLSNIIRTSDAIQTSSEPYPTEWNFETGEGHSATAIYNGRVYLLDYDEKLSSDMLRCFSLETGKELWRRWYRVPMKRNHGFSRTAPVINDQYIITIGPQGHIMCCDPVSGELKWTMDMKKQFQTEVPFWYSGQCPRLDGNTLLIAPAGAEILMAGIDIHTGEIRWQTPNKVNYKMSHSSIMPMVIEGRKTYVYAGIGGVCGVSGDPNDVGTLLWNVDKWNPSVIAPSPLQLSSNRIFLVAGYGSGGALLQVKSSGTKWEASIIEQYKPSTGIASEQQTPILYNGLIISVMPKDGGGSRGKLVCYAPADLHNPIWTSGADERFGLGPYVVINDKLFIFKDDGELYVYEILPKEMKLLKKQRIMDGIDAWAPMAYADGRLIVRDAHHVHCLKIN